MENAGPEGNILVVDLNVFTRGGTGKNLLLNAKSPTLYSMVTQLCMVQLKVSLIGAERNVLSYTYLDPSAAVRCNRAFS